MCNGLLTPRLLIVGGLTRSTLKTGGSLVAPGSLATWDSRGVPAAFQLLFLILLKPESLATEGKNQRCLHFGPFPWDGG